MTKTNEQRERVNRLMAQVAGVEVGGWPTLDTGERPLYLLDEQGERDYNAEYNPREKFEQAEGVLRKASVYLAQNSDLRMVVDSHGLPIMGALFWVVKIIEHTDDDRPDLIMEGGELLPDTICHCIVKAVMAGVDAVAGWHGRAIEYKPASEEVAK